MCNMTENLCLCLESMLEVIFVSAQLHVSADLPRQGLDSPVNPRLNLATAAKKETLRLPGIERRSSSPEQFSSLSWPDSQHFRSTLGVK